MNDLEAIRARHSVRRYTDRPIEGEVLEKLRATVERCNVEGDLSMQLCTNNLEAFGGEEANYGMFKNAYNHVALIGEKAPDLNERCGYYGEHVVLEAQKLGLNTCWAALSYQRKGSASEVLPGQKRVCVIAVGYGATQGRSHRVKPIKRLCRVKGEMPDWFRAGMEAAQLAPTAVNQQQFVIGLEEEDGAGAGGGKARVSARALVGPCSKIDLGIVKYHFELGADSISTDWEWTGGTGGGRHRAESRR